MEDFGSAALKRLIDDLPGAVTESHAKLGDATAVVEASRLVDVMGHLRDELDFEMLMDVTAVDYMGRSPRFEVVYHLYSVEQNQRVRIKVGLTDPDPQGKDSEAMPEVASVTDVYPSANWMEREVFDMYGIRFEGHPDLRRILLYDEFEGHPLRKDYPKERRQPLVGPRN
ncbi:MAG: NADH-quinone oxidoreductase subunit C [Myxococcota bacterium]